MFNNLQWEIDENGKWYNLFYTDFSNLNVSGVYVIWGLGKSYNDPRVIKVGQSTNLSKRIPQYQSEKGFNTVYSYQQIFGTIYITWADLQESHLDGVERYLGDLYRPLIAERFPDVVPIYVNRPF